MSRVHNTYAGLIEAWLDVSIEFDGTISLYFMSFCLIRLNKNNLYKHCEKSRPSICFGGEKRFRKNVVLRYEYIF